MNEQSPLKMPTNRQVLQIDRAIEADDALAQIAADTPMQLRDDERPSLGEMKVRVNTTLWELLPPSITLGEADDLACRILDPIIQAWDQHVSHNAPTSA